LTIVSVLHKEDILRDFIGYTGNQILLGEQTLRVQDGLGMWLIWGRQGMHTEIRWGSPLGKQPLGRLRRWEDKTVMEFRKIYCENERLMEMVRSMSNCRL
jgi:hypothetical protein